MSQIVLSLEDSNKAQFSEWLTAYCQRMGGGEFPYMGGGVYKIDYPYEVYGVNRIGFSARIKQPPLSDSAPPPGVDQCSIFDEETGKVYLYWEWVNENVINLSWLETGKRLKVTIDHEDAKWIIPPVFQILWAIRGDYPEIGETIARYIVEKADWWNMNPPDSPEDASLAYYIAEQARDEIKKVDHEQVTAQPVNSLADEQGGTAIYRRDKQGRIIPYRVVPNSGFVFEIGQNSIALKPAEGFTGGQVGAEEAGKQEMVRVSQRTEALNKLAVLWVHYNQTQRISKNDDMNWFIGENAKAVGLKYLTVHEFKKHLPKAREAKIIGWDKKKRRYIPRSGT